MSTDLTVRTTIISRRMGEIETEQYLMQFGDFIFNARMMFDNITTHGTKRFIHESKTIEEFYCKEEVYAAILAKSYSGKEVLGVTVETDLIRHTNQYLELVEMFNQAKFRIEYELQFEERYNTWYNGLTDEQKEFVRYANTDYIGVPPAPVTVTFKVNDNVPSVIVKKES